MKTGIQRVLPRDIDETPLDDPDSGREAGLPDAGAGE